MQSKKAFDAVQSKLSAMQEIIEQLSKDPSKDVSAKIRLLDATGKYSRMEIAVFLNKRYQHVRNILEQVAVATK